MSIKTGITGCTGRVGTLLVEALRSGDVTALSLAGGTVRSLEESNDFDFFVTDDAAALFEKSDVIIDFTSIAASKAHVDLASKTGTPLILATSGLTTDDEKEVARAAEHCPIVYAPNTSIAVTVMNVLVEQAAKALDNNFNIEIVEAHHKHKIDAPSGTAIMLGKTAAAARGLDFDTNAVLSREGETGARGDNDIGFATIRGGDVAGEHTVYFLGDGERLEIRNQSMNRSLYAKGALKAAEWIHGKPNGLYSMRDVLGL